MSAAHASTCPSCGHHATGRYCERCGAALDASTCPRCAKPLSSAARFCHHCGARVDGARRNTSTATALAWLVPGIALLALVAFLIGQRAGRGPGDAEPVPRSALDAPGAAPLAGLRGAAPDLSGITPEEAANRLFNRVMRYTEQGQRDSARTFAPMAIQAYEMLGPLDAHHRYDVGLIAVASGDLSRGGAEADTILAADRSYLLGLVLAIKVARLRGDEGARSRFEQRLVAAERAEFAKNLKAYEEHKPDIDAALRDARRTGR